MRLPTSPPRSILASRARLFVLVAAFLGLAALHFFLKKAELASNDASSSLPRAPIDGEAPPAATIDRALLADVKDSTEAERVVREPGPFLHLLLESEKLVAGDFRRMQAPLADDARYQEILADPAAWRGRPLVAKARFAFAKREVVPLADGVEELEFWRGVAGDDLGRTWSFSVLEEPRGIEPGDVIRIEGFFLKKLAILDSGEPTGLLDPTLHLVGRRVVKSFFHLPPVHELSPAVLASVRDVDLADRLAIAEEPLWHVLSYVENVDAEELAQQAEQGGDRASGEARYLTSKALLDHPERHRGSPVRILGSMSRDQAPWPQQLGPGGENPLDLPQLWHALLVHQGPSFTYLVSREPPPDWAIGDSAVLAEGVFLQLHSYEARNAETVTCPLVVVKRFVPFEVRSDRLQSGLSWALIGVSVPIVLGLLLLAMSDRRAAVELRARRSGRRGRRPGAASPA